MVSLSKFHCPICRNNLAYYPDHFTCESCHIDFKLTPSGKLSLTRSIMDKMAQKGFAEFPNDNSARIFTMLYKLDKTYFPGLLGVTFIMCNKPRNSKHVSECLDKLYELSKSAPEQELRYLTLYGGKPLFLKEGFPLIDFAVTLGKPEFLEVMLGHGVSANSPTALEKMTPLYVVAMTAKPENFETSCKIAEILYRYGGNPKATTAHGLRIINKKVNSEFANYLFFKLDKDFWPPIQLTPEQKERWIKDFEQEEKRQRRLNEPATWGVGSWILIILIALFILYCKFSSWT